MKHHSLPSILTVALVVASLSLMIGCWKSDESPDEIMGGEAVDLGREDMAALPGAEIDLATFEQFPNQLRQESTLDSQTIYGYYDQFFADRGWTMEKSVDPLAGAEVHRYQLGDELAFLTVTEIDPTRNEVILARRALREDEKNTTDF